MFLLVEKTHKWLLKDLKMTFGEALKTHIQIKV